ncbi:MAG: Rieske (2Fe-2S) protein [Nocardioides sp.]
MTLDQPTGPSRRTLLAAGAGTAVAATVVAGCRGGSGPAAPPAPAGSSSGSGGGSGGGGATPLAAVKDVPVGGAVSAKGPGGAPVIVAQPTRGTIVAFSAICTHMGCTVAPAGKILQCPCHGSTYDLATGDNTGGPAPSPLTKIPVTVSGGEVVEA